MADPLSVAASVVGLLAAAGKVAETLGPLISNYRDTPRIATAIYAEVNSSRIILGALQNLFQDLPSTPFGRRQLIQVDHLIATLTDGVLIFNELEPLVVQLGDSTERWRTRMRWTKEKGSLDTFVSRLQLFKVSMTVMLNILQCESDLEATRNQRELQALTTRLLDSNHEIALRLARLEPPSLGSTRAPSTHDGGRSSTMTSITHMKSFAFENDLQGSWVYRKALRPSDDVSCRQSIAFSHAWSSLSEVSLSEISLISVVALPITSGDLANGYHYQHNETTSSQVAVSGTVSEQLPVTLETSSDTQRWPFGIQPTITEDRNNESSLTRGVEPEAFSKGAESHESAMEESSEEDKPLIVHHNRSQGSVSLQIIGNELPLPLAVSMDHSDTNSGPSNSYTHTDAASTNIVSEHLDNLPMPAVLPPGESVEVFDATEDLENDSSAQEPAFAWSSSNNISTIPWPVLSAPRKSRAHDGNNKKDAIQAPVDSASEKHMEGSQDSLTSQITNQPAGQSAPTLFPPDTLYDADSEKVFRARSPRSASADNRRVKSSFPSKYTLVVFGDGSESGGKLDITTHFLQNEAVDGYDPIFDDEKVKKCVIDDEAVHIHIINVEHEDDLAMQEQYMRIGNGFLLVYSLTSRSTFESIYDFQQRTLRVKGKDYWPMVLVGYHGNPEETRQVTYEQGDGAARQYGCNYFEVSENSQEKIERAFFELVRDIRGYNLFDEKWKYHEKKQNRQKIKPPLKQTRKRGITPNRQQRKGRNASTGTLQEGFENLKVD